MRSITLCADDYGISRGVSRAIRDLLAQRTHQCDLGHGGACCVRQRRSRSACRNPWTERQAPAIGLHVTLTAPFKPLTGDFPHADEGRFCALRDLMRRGVGRRLEIAAGSG